MSQLTQIGACNNCGRCCYVYSNTLKRFHWCEFYSVTRPGGHCLVHKNRPEVCKSFPRGPDDLERVKLMGAKCSIQFVDEAGRVVDCWMDKNVQLTPIK